MNIQLLEGEVILKKGIANHMVHGMTFIGRLWLTNQRLFFCTRPLNFKQETITLPLTEIARLELPSILYIFNQGLRVVSTTGTQETFSVRNRKQWLEEITAAQKTLLNM